MRIRLPGQYLVHLNKNPTDFEQLICYGEICIHQKQKIHQAMGKKAMPQRKTTNSISSAKRSSQCL